METLSREDLVEIRKFEIGDLPQVAEIRNQSVAISPDFYSMTVDRVRPADTSDELPLTSEILVALVNGKVSGYIHIYTDPNLLGIGRINIDGLHVHPEAQRTGVGTKLLESAIAKAREWGGRYLSIAIPAAVESSQTFLMKHQFQLIRYFWRMRHSDLRALPSPQLPDGLRFRPFRAGLDEGIFVDLLNTCFADHWDYVPITREVLERWKRERPDFSPHGCFFILDGDREVALATTLIDRQRIAHTGDSCARIFELGVLPEYRGRGLGYNILLEAARFSREQELDALELIVDGQNDAAKRMYERVGFQEKRAILVFHKPL